MELTTIRTIAAPIDRVWALQLDHEHWPHHLPNFSRVERHGPAEPFGIGSSASITQPGLGTVDWTVTRYEHTAARRAFAWTGSSRGARYTGSHLVEAVGDGTKLTLGIAAAGPFITMMGWLVRGRMQKAIDDEAAAFERWALSPAEVDRSPSGVHR